MSKPKATSIKAACQQSIEEEQESQLKAKYPVLNRQGVGSIILQKRLNRGHKFFDSGDYNMARAKMSEQKQKFLPPQVEEAFIHDSTGETMATPDSVPAVRKKSMVSPATTIEAVNVKTAAANVPGGKKSPISGVAVDDSKPVCVSKVA